MPRKTVASKRRHDRPPPPLPEPQPPEYNDPIFVSPEAAKKYNNLKNKQIVYERPINFDELDGLHLDQFFFPTGWRPHLSRFPDGFPEAVYQFYANLTVARGTLHSRVLGTHLSLTITDICQALNVSHSGTPWPPVGFAWPHGRNEVFLKFFGDIHSVQNVEFLSLHNRLFHHIITYNFLPHGGNRDYVSEASLWLMSMLEDNQPINLGSIIYAQMKKCADNAHHTKLSLPYGRTITKLLHSLIDLSDLPRKPLSWTDHYNAHTLQSNMKIVKVNDVWTRLGRHARHDPAPAPPADPPVPHPHPSPPPADEATTSSPSLRQYRRRRPAPQPPPEDVPSTSSASQPSLQDVYDTLLRTQDQLRTQQEQLTALTTLSTDLYAYWEHQGFVPPSRRPYPPSSPPH